MASATMAGNKRTFNNFDDNRGNNKMARGDGKMTTRLLLFSKFCGAIVGKGGDIVKQLRERHRVQISGLNAFTEKRVLSVVGERNGIIRTLRDILPVAGVEAPNSAGKGGQKLPLEANVLVPAAHIGAVIGKGGSKIKEIMDASECRVQVYPDNLPNSTERVVAVGGAVIERVMGALDMLLSTIETLPKVEDLVTYDPAQDPDVAQGSGSAARGEKVGTVVVGSGEFHGHGSRYPGGQDPNMIGGAAGGNNPLMGGLGNNQLVTGNQLAAAYQLGLNPQLNLGGAGGVSNQNLLNQLSVMNNQGVGGLQGLRTNNITANQLVGLGGQNLNIQGGGLNAGHQGLQSQQQQQQQQQPRLNQGPPQARGGPMNNNQGNFNQNNGFNHQGNHLLEAPMVQLDFLQVKSKLEVTISPEICGALIGKGGSSIKEIKAVTGVKITIEGNEKGSKEDRVVTITGNQGQIQQASQMITQSVRNYKK